MNIEEFWIRVRAQIKAHKINIKQFAEYIGIPVSTFYSWLRYGRSVEVGTAYDIATALGVSVEYLVTGEEKKPDNSPGGSEIRTLIQNFKLLNQEDQKMVISITKLYKTRRTP